MEIKQIWMLKDSDKLRNKERLELITNACESYKGLLKIYHAAEKEMKKDKKKRINLSPMVAEKIFENERLLRILLKETIITLNDLRDSGGMEEIIKGAISDYSTSDGLSHFKNQYKIEIEKIKSKYPELDTNFIDENMDILFKHLKGINSKGDQLYLSFQDGSNVRTITIEPRPRPGFLGRVDYRKFFKSMQIITPSKVIFQDQTCHHLIPVQEEGMSYYKDNAPLDLYGATIAGLAYFREFAYWQGRKVSEVGLGAFTGSDPGTAATVAAIVAVVLILTGIVLVVIGYNSNNTDLIRAGYITAAIGFGIVDCGFISAFLFLVTVMTADAD